MTDSETANKSWAKPILFALLFAGLFICSRIAVLDMTVDQLAPVDEAVYQIPYRAIHMDDHGGPGYQYIHLWGQAYLVPVMKFLFRFTDHHTLVIHLLVVTIHATGLFFLLLLLFRWAGLGSALVLGLIFLFPDPVFFFWNVTLYGAYPEAYSLMAIPIFLWAFGLYHEKWNLPILFGAGLLSGWVMCFSPAVLFVACTLVLLVPLVRKFEGWVKEAVSLSAGMLVGLLPFLYWFITYGRKLQFADDYQGKLAGTTMQGMFSLPSASKISYLIHLWLRKGTAETPPMQIVFLIAIIGALVAPFVFRRQNDRWKVLFPASILISIFGISFFLDVQMLQTHHVLWFYFAQYVCLALVLGIPLLPGEWYADSKYMLYRLIEISAKGLLLALLLIPNLNQMAYLYQPNDAGMLLRYRGTEYYELKMGSLVGPEVDRVNRLIDQKYETLSDFDFQRGFRRLFPMTGIYSCCLKESVMPDWQQVQPVEDVHDVHVYYRGLGCAYALKTHSDKNELLNLPEEYQSPAQDGYDLCFPLR